VCALLKASLVVLGFSTLTKENGSFEEVIEAIGGGFEVSSFSGLPAGSGMGGSSILAAVALSAISKLWNREIDDHATLIDMVSAVEQVLTSGGGWQDPIGGIGLTVPWRIEYMVTHMLCSAT
jgi:fucokinase